jgi:hypothetical protein
VTQSLQVELLLNAANPHSDSVQGRWGTSCPTRTFDRRVGKAIGDGPPGPTSMTDMAKNKVFLGGPIHHARDENGCFDSRLKGLILCLVQVLERAGYEVLSAHVAEDFGNLPPPSSEELVLRDYGWLQLCDVYAALLVRGNSGEYIRSDGTHIEIGWASSMGKPIVIIGDDVPSDEHSHLLRGLGVFVHLQFVPIAEIESTSELLLSSVRRALDAAPEGQRRRTPATIALQLPE